VTTEAAAVAPPRGRPRSQKAHQAILQAAAELLLEQGLAEVSMDAVAARAGVSKATIYRWWPTKETLALDALYHEWQTAHPARNTGSLRGDLLSLLRPWARLAAQRPYGRVIAALATEARTDPAFAQQYLTRFVEPRRDQGRVIFHRAIERGEIPANTNIEVALDLLYGPIYHRLLHGHAPLTDRFVRDVIDTALNGIRPSPPSFPRQAEPRPGGQENTMTTAVLSIPRPQHRRGPPDSARVAQKVAGKPGHDARRAGSSSAAAQVMNRSWVSAPICTSATCVNPAAANSRTPAM
jgi:AcrR family transcriptional regulator